MKKIIFLLLLLVSSFALGQNTSLSTIQYPGTIPNWGGYLGTGTVVTPTDFSYPICRFTDANTEFNFDGILQGTSFAVNFGGSGVERRWNSDHTLLAVARNGAAKSLILQISFTGGVCTVSAVYNLNSKVSLWSIQTTQPRILYDLENGAILKYDFGPGGGCSLAAPCVSTIHDFTTGTCMTGLNPTWNSVVLDNHSDTMFAVGFSNNQGTGGQGTGTLVATWDTRVGKGESVMNTGSATVLGIAPSSICSDYGPQGVAVMIGGNCPAAGTGTCGTCTGAVACPDQTTLHEVYASPNDTFPWVMYDLGSPCSQCGTDTSWVWKLGTLNVVAGSFSGHHAEGWYSVFHSCNSPQGQHCIFQVMDTSGNLIFPITRFTVTSTSSPNNLPASGATHIDDHISWPNDNVTDTTSPLITTTTYFNVGANNINNYVPSGKPPTAMPGIQCLSVVGGCKPTTNPIPGFAVNELTQIPLTNPPGGATPCGTSPCTTLPENRWVHTFNSVVSQFFNAQNTIMGCSPLATDGSMSCAWSTDDFCEFGDPTNDANVICGGPDWNNNTSGYVVGNIISPLTGNLSNYTFVNVACAGTCTSQTTPHPTWPQIDPVPITAWSITSNVATFTVNNVQLTFSSVANASGGNTVYNGFGLGGAGNAFAGQTLTVAGYTNSGNNGVFVCAASTNTTLTLINGSGIAETHAATGTVTFAIGQLLNLGVFPTSTFFNGQQMTVLSSGLSATQFSANFTHANGSATETGQAQVTVVDNPGANQILWANVGVQTAREDVLGIYIPGPFVPPPATPPAPALGLFAIALNPEKYSVYNWLTEETK